MAILGSKGSGKKALLDVIACRAEDTSRGQVLLNGSTLTKSMFQHRCGYVTHAHDFISGLTVSQTLHYTPTVVSTISNSAIRNKFIRSSIKYYFHFVILNCTLSS